MKKVKIGVIGAGRGKDLFERGELIPNAEFVAMCDKWEVGLEPFKGKCATYTDFDEFLKHDMDAVVLANYAHEHAPFAIKAMKAGKHVFSEVMPFNTLKEGVELIETVEQTGKIYAYGENYCYRKAPYEMRRLYREGKLGEFEYGEGEYIHNGEPIWPEIAYGDKNHWRNNMYSTFYCTHSLGPIIHITGLRPISVVGFESVQNERRLRTGSKFGQYGVEMVTLENGAIVKSTHGSLYRDSVWYSVYCSKGSAESSREAVEKDGAVRIYTNIDSESGAYDGEWTTYKPEFGNDEIAAKAGHGGSDFYSIYHFVEYLSGNENADIIDIYEAADMFLPGLFAYRSILAGSVPMEVPNFREKAERDKWRNDTACTFPEKAGDMLLPTCKSGTPEIDDAVYEKQRKLWEKVLEERRKNQ